MAELDNTNDIFKLAVDLVNQSNRNIFLTGKAGTGKTTFLRYIKEHSLKQTAVVAPTGVAAINAGGTTIHSFFQLPFSPFLPEAKGFMQADANNRHTLFGKIKLNSERIKVIRQLELLIIDEISMVRCDLLDSIDAVLRHFRFNYNEPFGGVQVLLIGDMHQLPPVAADHEWNLLSQFYNSPYFFDSRIMQQSPPVYVEFKKIYRQSDDRFINLLNQVRNNNVSDAGKQLLESLYKPEFKTDNNAGYITLTTHNYKADAINAEALSHLTARAYTFKAVIEGDFNEKAYPADDVLQLKEGAQVMFIKNDKEKSRRYYNGKIGTIVRITEDGIFVKCKDSDNEIEVGKETWENLRYTINKASNHLEEDVIGSFTQYPLRLAWAITIHKSQGLTFEKAVIDAGDAFAPGQVYVALSRCTSLDGIILQSRITPSGLRSDETIVHFSKNIATAELLSKELDESKKIYQQQLLILVFDLMLLLRNCADFKKIITDNKKDFNEATLSWLDNIEQRLIYLQEVAIKFKAHLNNFFSEGMLPELNEALQSRTMNAAAFFSKELGDVLQMIAGSPAVTDSKQKAKQFNDAAKELFVLIAEKKHIAEGFTSGFYVNSYYQQKKNFVVPAVSINAYATASAEKKDTPHPRLHFQLRELRNKICEQKNMPVYMVANGKAIDDMAMYLPQTPEELLKISGFGKTKVAQYGNQFLDIINNYTKENGLSSAMNELTPKRERKPKEESALKVDTKNITYELFKQGRSASEIAGERKLALSTIEGHLAFYVSKGVIPVEELLSREKFILIEPHIQNMENRSLSPIKEKLGDVVSFSEIRLAIAAHEWKNQQENENPEPSTT